MDLKSHISVIPYRLEKQTNPHYLLFRGGGRNVVASHFKRWKQDGYAVDAKEITATRVIS